MQMKFSKSVAALVAGMISVSLASAHPGHAPTDPVAQVSQPLAGADHFAAFLALTSLLLLTLRALVKYRAAKKETARR
jgi:hydrogenase/urease accessory protein HupE